jgi:Fe-S-cluster containining protein
MPAFYENQPLLFECTRCGRCCATAGDYYVFLDAGEAERIRAHLRLSAAWFRRRYLERLDDDTQVLAASADERCIFLGPDGACRIYPVRPLQCRTYPFWPEVVASRRAWQQEARRCEGINRGRAVPVARVRRTVRACLSGTE